MRYIKIFFLYLQQVFEQRSYVLVYLLMSLFNPILLVLFWQGATIGGKSVIPGWDFMAIASYYFYLTIVGGLIMAYVEEPVAKHHIKEGDLVMYLLKPLSYYLQMFFSESSWRLVRTCFGVIIMIVFFAFWGKNILLPTNSLIVWFIIICILIFGFILSFTFKMILGISAFWLTETRGLFELIEAIFFIFAGFLMPIVFLPSIIRNIAYLLPFSYIIYFPVLAIEGKLTGFELIHVILMQVFWIAFLYAIYYVLWLQGVKKFTAAGQ